MHWRICSWRSHRHATAGIGLYEFNELFDTNETIRWVGVGGRQFVITFKDIAIEVIARDASVLATGLRTGSANAALLFAIDHARTQTSRQSLHSTQDGVVVCLLESRSPVPANAYRSPTKSRNALF
jgi:hypothetical protein